MDFKFNNMGAINKKVNFKEISHQSAGSFLKNKVNKVIKD